MAPVWAPPIVTTGRLQGREARDLDLRGEVLDDIFVEFLAVLLAPILS